jgi:hypothetical protein
MWDEGDSVPMALGCTACLDRKPCGGIRKEDRVFSCLDNCCRSPATCDSMCPNNPPLFMAKMREINGLELDNLPASKPCPAQPLPGYVSYIYHGNRRAAPLDVEAVALPLRLFYCPEGTLRFTSRAEIEAKFHIGPRAAIVLIGSGRDKAIEDWWELSARRAAVLAALRGLGVVLITSPNYSMFTNEVRYNDMHSMKRIGIVWQEIVEAGIPGAYHLNAATQHDYERLTGFITERPEVTDVSFEFKTGAAWRRRLPFHIAELSQLAGRVGRPLHLVMIGGTIALPALSAAFARVTYVDTSAFMKTMHRQRLYLGNDGKIKKTSELTLTGQPLDRLLGDNVAMMQARIEFLRTSRG